MRFLLVPLLLAAALGGCSSSEAQRFSVYFEPYSAKLDLHGLETIQTAGHFAQGHPGMPVAVVGYAAPPDPLHDVEGLSAQRAEVVKQVLLTDGLNPTRITIIANGVTDPKTLPMVAVRRVDIDVGK
jgi:outer membrane protein OmpA-like peptidoglycan-associated protein